jgi:homoserine kinase
MIARVPATSANMGPGFDSLGVALTLWAEVGVVEGKSDELPEGAHLADEHHLATIAYRGLGGTGRLWVRSPIPMGRGLGYSAAVRVAGLLLACAERPEDVDDPVAHWSEEVLAAATALEGHADNAAPALLGGVVATSGDRSLRVPLQLDPAVVVWVPQFSTRTDHSRAKLADSVPLADAVHNIGRTAMLVAALAAGDAGALRHAVDDRIHQPARFDAAPATFTAYRAALDAGAWCAWLSGSGPSVAAFCSTDSASELAASLPDDGHAKILRIDYGGAALE